jgi:hypothetical protein
MVFEFSYRKEKRWEQGSFEAADDGAAWDFLRALFSTLPSSLRINRISN